MNPALYIEALQTLRGVGGLLLLLFAAAFALRSVFGAHGILMAAGLLVPQAASLVGVGAFLEELSKGQMRFLFALPLRRGTLFAVKVLGGLAGAVMVAAAVFAGVAAAHLLSPVDLTRLTAVLAFLNVDPRGAALGVAAYASYSFTGGLFAILMCRETKHGQFLNLLFSYSPLVAIALQAQATGRAPSLYGMAAAFAAAAVTLGIGSWHLFVRRNPFDDAASLVPRGLTFVAAAAAVFAAAMVAVGPLRPGRHGPDPRRVVAFQVAPDCKAVQITTLEPPSGTAGYLLDAHGRVAFDLGPSISMPPAVFETWSPDGRWLLFRQLPETYVAGAPLGHWVLFDRTSGASRVLPPPGDGTNVMIYSGWTADGRVLGTAQRWKPASGQARPHPRYFLQELASGRAEDLELPGAPAGGQPQLVAGRELAYETGEGATRELVLLDLASRQVVRVPLGHAVTSWTAAADGSTLLVARRDVDAGRMSYRLVAIDRTSGEQKTLLSPPDLPEMALEDAARGERGSVDLLPLRGSGWVRCLTDTHGGPVREWLVDLHGLRVLPVAEPGGPAHAPWLAGIVAPDGERLLLSDQDGRSSSNVRIVALGPDGLRPVATHVIDGDSVAWLGSSQLLYLRHLNIEGDPESLDTAELWVIDVESGARRRFFDGAGAAVAR